MRLYNVYGKPQSKQVTKFLVDWDKPCRSKVQFKTKQFLKAFWQNQVVYEEFPVYGTKMKVDILNATKKIAIEVHEKEVKSLDKEFFLKKFKIAL